VWHVSIALYGPDGGAPLDTASVDRKRRRLAFALGHKILDGVGVSPSREQIRGKAFHVRRALSPEEIARLPPGWLALPAVDDADGPGEDPGRLVP
jgi:hypothetical protein